MKEKNIGLNTMIHMKMDIILPAAVMELVEEMMN